VLRSSRGLRRAAATPRGGFAPFAAKRGAPAQEIRPAVRSTPAGATRVAARSIPA